MAIVYRPFHVFFQPYSHYTKHSKIFGIQDISVCVHFLSPFCTYTWCPGYVVRHTISRGRICYSSCQWGHKVGHIYYLIIELSLPSYAVSLKDICGHAIWVNISIHLLDKTNDDNTIIVPQDYDETQPIWREGTPIPCWQPHQLSCD